MSSKRAERGVLVVQSMTDWVAESVALVGVEETIELLHDAYLSDAPDPSIVAALATLGDTTFA